MNKRMQIAGKELPVFTVEAQEAVWSLAPRDWVGKRKAAIAGIARDLGWKFSRTWNIAHGRARRIDAEEWETLKARLSQVEQGIEKCREINDDTQRRLAALRSQQAG